MKRRLYPGLSLLVSLALCAGIFSPLAACSHPASPTAVSPDAISVAPVNQRDGYLLPDTGFIVSFEKDQRLSVEALEDMLRLSPDIPFTLSKGDLKGTYQLTPDRPFPEDSLVTIKFVDASGQALNSFAYQTLAPFGVERTLPRDDSTYVDLDTGIEVALTRKGVTKEEFSRCFSLSELGSDEYVAGRVEIKEDGFIFIPQTLLKEGATYIGRISKDLRAQSGEALGDTYTFTFETEDRSDDDQLVISNLSGISQTFLSSDAPIINVACTEKLSEIPVSIYRFHSFEAYSTALIHFKEAREDAFFPRRVHYSPDPAQTDEIGTFDALTVFNEDRYYSYGMMLLLPNYDPGWYCCVVQYPASEPNGKSAFETFFQISDVAVYSAQTDNDMLCWLNDASTGQPLRDAQVTVSSRKFDAVSGVSNEEGIVSLNLPDIPPHKSITGTLAIQQGDTAFVDLIDLSSDGPPTGRELYTAYFCADRKIYHPSDTIQFWGVVRPRASGTPVPDNLRVSVEDLYDCPVTLNADGTFIASLDVTRLESTSYEITLEYGAEDRAVVLDTEYIRVEDFVKPDLVYGVDTDKSIYWAGDTAAVTFSASFFDGTPAHQQRASLSMEDDAKYEFVTGENGEAMRQISLPESRENNRWRPERLPFYISTEGDYFEKYLWILYRDRALRCYLSEENVQKVIIKTNAIDISGIDQYNGYYDESEKLLAAPADVPVTVDVHQYRYIKTPSRSYYDGIRKKNVVCYDYTREDQIIETRTTATQGGTVELDNLPVGDDSVYYYLVVRIEDSKGRPVENTIWLGGMLKESRTWETKRSFFLKRALPLSVTSPFEDFDTYNDENHYFHDKETASFTLYERDNAVKTGRLLTVLVQKGIQQTSVSDSMQTTIPFNESLIPNYVLTGAYFDGRHIYLLPDFSMWFDEEDSRRLNVSIIPDKESYRPGETASVSILAAYPNGSPAAHTSISLGLVDEALCALGGAGSSDPLGSLYRTAYYPEVNEYISYYEYILNPPDEGSGKVDPGTGGGDGDSPALRDIFKDTAAFVTMKTDASGEARASIQLPHNITTWRATAQAVSSDLYGGSHISQIVVTQPLFVHAAIPKQFLAGDTADLVLRAYGKGVSAALPVEYTIKLEGNGGESVQTVHGNAGSETVAPLGLLEKGDYLITVTARALQDGNYLADSVKKTVKVSENGVEAQLCDTFDLQDGIAVDPERFPVMIGVYTSGSDLETTLLDHLLCAWGGRTDQRAARRWAYKRVYGEEPPYTDYLEDTVSYNGEVSLFAYDSPDTELAAKFHLAVPELLADVAFPTLEFENYHAAAAMLLKAVHGKPVLDEIQARLKSSSYFIGYEDNLYLMAALAALGDTQGAAEWYQRLVTPLMASSYTAAGETMRYVSETAYEENLWQATLASLTASQIRRPDAKMTMSHASDPGYEKNLRLTALASLTASQIRHPDAEGMMRYLLENRSGEELYLLEEIVYLQNVLPKERRSAKIAVNVAGDRQIVDLQEGQTYYYRFTEQEFQDVSFKLLKGEAKARVWYTGNIKNRVSKETSKIGIIRSISPMKGGEIKMGEIVKVTLAINMDDRLNPDGMTIDEYVPSGLRFLYADTRGWDSGWRLQSDEGQKIRFCYHGEDALSSNKKQPSGPARYESPEKLVYYAWCAAPGEYQIDPAFAQCDTGTIWGASDITYISGQPDGKKLLIK